ncbi:MAG TPA: condensation domain-containing protein [Allosphingosinicella sp.]|nr:condensation domain-containing protein [Allosphingosinicella sp.]
MFPLTYGQRWLVHVLEQQPDMAQPVQRIWRLERPFDSKAFLAAVCHVVAAHPALRMRLVRTEAGWAQSFPKAIPEVDALRVTGRTAADRAAYMRFVFAEDAASPFDLTTEPPLRVKVVDVDGEIFVSASLDHIAGDDIAFDLIEREIGLAYRNERAGTPAFPSRSDELFRTYLREQVRFRDSESKNLEWWREKLAGAPLDRRREDESDWAEGAACSWTIAGETLTAATQACRAARVSMTAACVAAQACLRSELLGTGDVVVNIPVSNRLSAQDHLIIGNLSMLLHVRIRVPPRPDRLAFVQSVRDGLLEAMAHRNFDYAALSRSVAEEASARGGEFCWRWGFSGITERAAPVPAPGLFAERLDNCPSPGALSIPTGSCVITMRQRAGEIGFAMEAPALRDGADMAVRYLELLGDLLDVRELSGIPLEAQ